MLCPKKSALASGVTLGSDTVFSRGSTNTEPGADRGPRAGSPRGVVDATGFMTQPKSSEQCKKCSENKVTLNVRPGRYRSRFCIRRPTETRSLNASAYEAASRHA